MHRERSLGVDARLFERVRLLKTPGEAPLMVENGADDALCSTYQASGHPLLAELPVYPVCVYVVKGTIYS